MKNYLRESLILFLSLLLLSCCRGKGILDNVSVNLVKPEKVVSLVADTSHCIITKEMEQYQSIRIFCDTIIVLQKWVIDDDGYHFSAYSSNSLQYLGSFARKGRGPEEILDPYVIITNSVESNLNFQTNGFLEETYAIDVAETLQSGHIVYAHHDTLPSSTIMQWTPLPECRHFVLSEESGRLVKKTIGSQGEVLNTFLYDSEIADRRYMTYLSSIFVRNEESGKVAEIMLCLPQINLFDTSSGEAQSIAVNTDFRKWSSNSKRMLDMNSIQYFEEAAASSGFIIVTYKGVPFEKLISGCQGTSIQIFDWNGNFKYDIRVSEDISKIAFDSKNKYLYCVERSEERLVRYNLSHLI